MHADVVPIDLTHRETGDPAGDPVVLLHGMGSSAATWDGFAPALARAGRRVLAIDARGHGASPATPDYSFDAMVGDLLAFLDAHLIVRVDLVGHSMGGAVAMLFAGRHPERVRRLVVEEPLEQPGEPPQPVAVDRRLVGPVLRELRTPERRALLRRITAPTLIVAGGSSSVVPQDRIREAATVIPDVRLVEIDAGHHVHERAPAAFTAVVLEFLATLG